MASGLNRFALALVSAALSASSLFALQAAPPPKFDSYVAQVLQTFRVPGVAVGAFTRAEAKALADVAKTERKAAASRHSTAGPSLPLSRYARMYRDDCYGDVTGDRELRADAYVTLDLNPDGSIELARIAPAWPTVDFSFEFQDLLLRPVPQ